MIKVVVGPFGRILGAGIVGPHGGEVIQTWCLALRKGLRIGDVAGMIASYPTIGYSNRKVAETSFLPFLAGRVPRVFLRLLRYLR